VVDAEYYKKAIRSCEEQLKNLQAELKEAGAMPLGVARDHVLSHFRLEIARVEDELENFQWALSQE
jgi:hypothetical protein